MVGYAVAFEPGERPALRDVVHTRVAYDATKG